MTLASGRARVDVRSFPFPAGGLPVFRNAPDAVNLIASLITIGLALFALFKLLPRIKAGTWDRFRAWVETPRPSPNVERLQRMLDEQATEDTQLKARVQDLEEEVQTLRAVLIDTRQRSEVASRTLAYHLVPAGQDAAN